MLDYDLKSYYSKANGGRNMLQLSIKAARINAGYSAVEVANAMKISVRTYSDIETGKREIKPSELVFLSSLFEIPVDMMRVG